MIHTIQVVLDETATLNKAGKSEQAIELCESAFQHRVKAGEAAELPDLALEMGWSYYWLGKAATAEEYHLLALELAHLQDNSKIAGRALNGIAVIKQEHGELSVAEANYYEALPHASDANDNVTVGNIHQNLGIISTIRGDLDRALKFYERAIKSYEAEGAARKLSGVLNNLGVLLISRKELDEAAQYLTRALEVANNNNDVVTEGIVHINRTELHLARGDHESARQSCDEAFEIAARLGDDRHKSDVLKFYGIIFRESGKPHLAETHLRQSIAISVAGNNPLTEAEAWRELALVLRGRNRNREALEALNRSHELFSLLQARRWQEEIDERISELKDDFVSLVSEWGQSIEAKDRYTVGHCERVAAYACHIARLSGLPDAEMVWFRMGAFLHDVGKMDTPEEILNKPGRLTDEERHIIEQHTVIGDQLLSSIEFPWDIRPMVRSHHERWDGKGYPDQLAGENIPFTARILRIADVFDALTTNRSYRKPLTPEEALKIMQEDQGSFDPELFSMFVDSFDDVVAISKSSERGDWETAAVDASVEST